MFSLPAVFHGLDQGRVAVRAIAVALVVGLSSWGCSDHGPAPAGSKDHGHGHDHDHGPGGHSHGPGDDHSHAPGTDHSPKTGDHSGAGHAHEAPHGGQVQSVGDHHFELTYDAEAGRFTLYVLAGHDGKAMPIESGDVALQVRAAESSEFMNLSLAADAQSGEPDGKSSRFAAASDEFKTLGDFTAVARVAVAGETHRVSFQFAGGKPGK